MKIFKSFPESKIDDDILELYFDIEVLISEIDENLSAYLKHLYSTDYYKSNPKDKNFFCLQKINWLFKRLKEEFKSCYTIRENKKHFDFSKSRGRKKEKKDIVLTLNDILNLLRLIDEKIKSLEKTNIKGNDFSFLVSNIEKICGLLIKEDRVFKKITEKDENKVYDIIDKIVKDAENNKRNNIWLASQTNNSKLLFSKSISMKDLRVLELVPILELKGLDKRSFFINEIHKDSVLPLFHYNININGKNIHVIPKELNVKLKNFLIYDKVA